MAEIPLNAKKELFQFGCLKILTSQVGIDIAVTHADFEKVDCLLTHPGLVYPKDDESGPIVKVQLKATASPNFTFEQSILSFQIEKEFCRLVRLEKAVKRYLFVMHCHQEDTSWVGVDATNNHIKVQHLMYWAGYHDFPDVEISTNLEDMVTIRIPRNQVVNSESLKKIMSAQANRQLSIVYRHVGREVSDE